MGPLDEEAHCRHRRQLVEVEVVQPVHVERLHVMDVLAGDRERLTARREDRDVGRGLQDPLRQRRDRLDEMLTVVEDEQEFLGPEDIDDGEVDRLVLTHAHVEFGRHGGERFLRGADTDEFDERDALAVPRGRAPRQLEGQRGLADAAGPDDREEPGVRSSSPSSSRRSSRPTRP